MQPKPVVDMPDTASDSPQLASDAQRQGRTAPTVATMSAMPRLWVRLGVAVLLVAVTVAVFGRACQYGFLLYDDNHYVTSNEHVRRGLSWDTLVWAFQPDTLVAANWHPLTVVAHLLDVRLFGLDARGHHAMSVGLHVLNVLLLLVVLARITGRFWPSAMVAALFAWHPLHVESVAWIAERKDVLSTLFWFLTLAAYAAYAAQRSWGRYALVALCLTLGLLAKPMLVTVPAVLLLLDFWPLQRVWPQKQHWPQKQQLKDQGKELARSDAAGQPSALSPGGNARQRQTTADEPPAPQDTAVRDTPVYEAPPRDARTAEAPASRSRSTVPNTAADNSLNGMHRNRQGGWRALARLVIEKVPLLIVVAVFSATTLYAQHQSAAVADLRQVPLDFRLKNAVVSYTAYLEQTVWPARLAAIYPMLESNVRTSRLAWSAGVLAVISAVVVWQMRKRPYLAVGWFWYLGTLVPVIGLVQVGGQARADRYTYVPLIGIFLMIAFAAAELAQRSRRWRAGTVAVCLAWLAVLAPLAWRQVGFWRDHATLFRHTLEVTGPNYLAHYHLANGLTRQFLDGPWSSEAERQAMFDAALEHYRRSLTLAPSFNKAHYNFACALWHGQRFEEAARHFRTAIQLGLDGPLMRISLAECLEKLGHLDKARQQYAAALQRDPESREALLAYARLSGELGDAEQQIAAYRLWLRNHQEDVTALRCLAWVYATSPQVQYRNGRQALVLARRAAEATSYQHPRVLETLAAAYAESGDFKSAVEFASRAIAIWRALEAEPSSDDRSTGKTESAQIASHVERLERQIERYRRRRPWRSSAAGTTVGSRSA